MSMSEKRTDPVSAAQRVVELEVENARLREALTRIRDTDPVDAALDPDRAVRIAAEALQEPGA